MFWGMKTLYLLKYVNKYHFLALIFLYSKFSLYLCTRKTKNDRGVAQLVAFLVWDQAVAGSSPVTSTKTKKCVCPLAICS